ncbi:MAG: glucose 1-dehydrogenase [Rhodospirillaceae bacterium]|nr:glucose 1-dehydrogenase [Rhodospirillaceae bacterium]
MRCSGKVAIVTGGAMGIGQAIVQALLAEGASVVIADREGAAEAAKALDNAQNNVVGVPCDVSSQSETEAMASAALEAFGRIDVLVNNAGIYSSLQMTPFEDLDIDEWRRVLEVNVIGQAMATRAVVPAMRRQGGGSVVNLSSGTPFKGVPFMLHYVASKGAVNAMTKALAKELGAADIRVNGVAPGFTLSDGVLENPHQLEKLQEISRQARVIQRDQHPDDIVGAVIFFASQDSAFVTGQTLVVDGGAYFH